MLLGMTKVAVLVFFKKFVDKKQLLTSLPVLSLLQETVTFVLMLIWFLFKEPQIGH